MSLFLQDIKKNTQGYDLLIKLSTKNPIKKRIQLLTIPPATHICFSETKRTSS